MQEQCVSPLMPLLKSFCIKHLGAIHLQHQVSFCSFPVSSVEVFPQWIPRKLGLKTVSLTSLQQQGWLWKSDLQRDEPCWHRSMTMQIADTSTSAEWQRAGVAPAKMQKQGFICSWGPIFPSRWCWENAQLYFWLFQYAQHTPEPLFLSAAQLISFSHVRK